MLALLAMSHFSRLRTVLFFPAEENHWAIAREGRVDTGIAK